MSAERMPLAKTSILVRPIGTTTRLALAKPRLTVLFAVVLAVVASLYAITQLQIRSSRLDLLNPESNYNKLWIEYIKDFGDQDDIVVVVEGSQREHVVAAIDQVADMLSRQEDLFELVLHRVDISAIRSKGLYYLSLVDLSQIDQFLTEVQPILHNNWSSMNLATRTLHLVNQTVPDSALEKKVVRLCDSVLAALRQPIEHRSMWPEITLPQKSSSPFATDYLLNRDGRLGLVLLQFPGKPIRHDHGRHVIERLRQRLAILADRHAGVTIGLTGLPVIEHDEMVASSSATTKASVLSLAGVFCVFVACFGGSRYPLLTVATLCIALAWSLGYVTLAIGHLNILSMAFGVILIGLGIDFCIHYFSRYVELRQTIDDCSAAIQETAMSVGPGIMTGGLTTSLAFFTAGLTEFTGIAELGVIAGGGILLCLLATLLVLPAMIVLLDRGRPRARGARPLNVASWFFPLYRIPRTIFFLSLLATTGCMVGIVDLWYDHNLLNLQPVDLESVDLEKKLLAENDESLWFALSIADDRESLLLRKQNFLNLESVARTEEIISLFPADVEIKQPRIEEIRQRLLSLPSRPPRIPVNSPEELVHGFTELAALAIQKKFDSQTKEKIAAARQSILQLTSEEYYQQISQFQHSASVALLDQLHALRRTAHPKPPQLTDLPEALTRRFVGKSGRFLLKIYGKGSLWNMDALQRFVREVRTVDPRTTGKPLQTFEASRQMLQSYLQAAFYSLLAVTLVLLVDFRSLFYVLLALLPVSLGMAQMLGILGYFRIPLNPANMIVLPLILGIGIDDGVHVIHDFRSRGGQFRLSNSTATAILITSLTTMIGFGSLMIASHRGLQSLGRVLTIGISCCMLTSLVTLPALLTWISSRRKSHTTAAPLIDQHGQLSETVIPTPSPKKILAERSPVDTVAH